MHHFVGSFLSLKCIFNFFCSMKNAILVFYKKIITVMMGFQADGYHLFLKAKIPECQNCLEFMQNPGVAPCGHLFCSIECIDRISSITGDVFTCPTCRARNPVSIAMGTFPVNHLYKSIMDFLWKKRWDEAEIITLD